MNGRPPILNTDGPKIPLVLFLAAVGCFIVFLLIALNVITGHNAAWDDWLAGGLISFAAAHLPWQR